MVIRIDNSDEPGSVKKNVSRVSFSETIIVEVFSQIRDAG
jgi:hypothetical protein